jgi:excisionase family DNA binding protein
MEENMNTPNTTRAITKAATRVLSEAYPNLTPEQLESALAFKPEGGQTETLVSRREGATVLRISLPTVDRMLSAGELTRVTVRGRVFIRRSEIDRIISGNKQAVQV